MTDHPIPDDVSLGAQAGQARYYVPSSVAIAQWALESSWGAHMPPGSNNPFGIKALDGQAFVSAMTWEVIAGHNTRIEQKFAKYGSLADGFEAHARLLATHSIYKPAMDAWYRDRDLRAGVALMAQHYATDPQYAAKLMSIIETNELVRFDTLPSDRAKLAKAAAAAGVAPTAAPKASTVAPAPDLSPVPAAPAPAAPATDPLSQIADAVSKATGLPNLLPGGPSPAGSAASPAANESTTMNPLVAISIIEQVMTYAPQAEHILANIPDIIAKGKDAIVKFEAMDFQDGITDIEAIVADLGISQATLANVMKIATKSAPVGTVATAKA